MDLFTPVVTEDEFHPNFKQMMLEKEEYTRDVLRKWAEGFEDRDNKFVKEFQTTFNSCFWELYLHACIKELGYNIDFTKSSPDFVVNSPGKEFSIEAVIANYAKDSTPEWENSIEHEIEREDIVDFATIRLANALDNKFKKFQKSYSKLEYVKDKPFVLAVAPFEQPQFYRQNTQAIIRVLYGCDIPKYVDLSNGERIILGETRMMEFKKPNGSTIPLGIFLNEQYSDISAVIFSNCATHGKARVLSEDPGFVLVESIRYNDYGTEAFHDVKMKQDYNESLLDGLYIFHNPLAKNPFNFEELYHSDIAHYSFDIEEERMEATIKHEMLYHRHVFKMAFHDDDGSLVETPPHVIEFLEEMRKR